MSSYPPPNEVLPIFNPANFNYASQSLTLSKAESLFVKLAGNETVVGPLTFTSGIYTGTIKNSSFTGTLPTLLASSGTFLTDVTGASLSANNIFTGNNTFSNNITTPGFINGAGTFTLPNTLGSSGTILTTGTLSFSSTLTLTAPGSNALSTGTLYSNPTTSSTGATTSYFFNVLKDPTFNVTSGTVTNASTLYIAGAPVNSGVGTLTNSYSLWVPSGIVRIDDVVQLPTGTTPTLTYQGHTTTGTFLNGDFSTFEELSFATSGITRATIGKNISNGNSYFNVFNTDNTQMIGCMASNGTGSGSFQIYNGNAAYSNISYAGGGVSNCAMPTTSGFLLQSTSAYNSVASKGLTLSDAQTIVTQAYLAGATLNMNNSTYTDSATPLSGTLTQFSDVVIGQRTINCSNTGVTYTNAASLRIRGAPIQGTNLTITNNAAIQLDSGQIVSTSNGTAANPIFSVGGLSTGMFASASNTLNFSVSGSNKLTMTTASISAIQQFRAASGTQAAPGLSFSGDNATGLYLVSAANPALSVNNTTLLSYTSTAVSIAVAGTNLAPSLYWSTNSTSGFYQASANNIGIACSSVPVMDWTSTQVSVNVAGSAGTPSLQWATDTTTGLYRPLANQLGISCSGSNIGTWSSTGLAVVGKVSSSTLQVGSGTTYNQIQTGKQTLVAPNIAGSGGQFTATAVTFPNAFSSTPTVTCSLLFVAGGTNIGGVNVVVFAVSTTQVQFFLQNNSGSSTTGDIVVCYTASN